ncbi:MAG: GNAT family N-acetyltransferase [Candidatus Thalassarchaeaceae archaeon]|nr:GNAT family N-acetyltransferase [Candidatus Thalassarchaeaceae archaeon]
MTTAVNPKLTVIAASHQDISSVEMAWWRLLHDQQLHDFRGPHSSLQTQHNRDRVRRFLESRIRLGRVVIARLKDELVGISTFAPDGFILDGEIQVWEIADVWVEPHARRQGIGSAMVQFCEHECMMRGASEVRLTVYEKNRVALDLYASMGYDSKSFTLSKQLSDETE